MEPSRRDSGGTGGNDDTGAPHHGQTTDPITVLHRIPASTRNTGVEPNTSMNPVVMQADRLSELTGVVILMMVAECVLCVPEQVLSIYA